MTNPRKFADKLEIIRRKEEEANAAFDKIMQEVSDARMGISPPLTTISPHYPQGQVMRSQNVDYMKMRQKYKGGSLPNVNTSFNQINLQSSFPGLNEPYNNHQNGYPGPIFPTKAKRSYTVSAPYRTNSLQPAASIAEQGDGVQLWRRTFSDSAIQQALQQLPKKTSTSPQMQHRTSSSNNGLRLIQKPSPSIKNDSEVQAFNNSMKMNFSDKCKPQNSVQIQANTSSLPDLSNLSIPSPIQNPIDNEQDIKLNIDDQRNAFQTPYNLVPRRSVGKQVYRGLSPNSDVIETFHREQKGRINLYPNLGKNELTMVGGLSRSTPCPTPLSPVSSQPFYWNNQTVSPLVSNDMISSHPSLQNDLQQLQQYQMQAENQSTYIFDSRDNSYDLYYSNNQYPNKSPIYRQNLAQLGNNNVCGQTLDFMKFKNSNELSEADLNSVGVTLDPLDLRILSDDNTELVDQSAEEQFRLERANYH